MFISNYANSDIPDLALEDRSSLSKSDYRAFVSILNNSLFNKFTAIPIYSAALSLSYFFSITSIPQAVQGIENAYIRKIFAQFISVCNKRASGIRAKKLFSYVL